MEVIAILFFFWIYLLFSTAVVKAAAGWARRRQRRPWLWGGVAAFGMYNLVFWDWIPTMIAYRYYCGTQAGFTVFKTPEQWKVENPELTAEDLEPLGKKEGLSLNFPRKSLKNPPNKKVPMVNQRIYFDSEKTTYLLYPIPIHKWTDFIADINNNQRLAELVTFQTGYGSMMNSSDWRALKFWLQNGQCGYPTSEAAMRDTGYMKFLKQFTGQGD